MRAILLENKRRLQMGISLLLIRAGYKTHLMLTQLWIQAYCTIALQTVVVLGWEQPALPKFYMYTKQVVVT